MKIQFPHPDLTDPHGIIYVGGSLTQDNLLEAYSRGIFPWPHEGYPLLWFCPEERGVLDFSRVHISKSLRKLIRQKKFKVTFDQAFEKVMMGCSEQKRAGQKGTWITPEMIGAYKELHGNGYAHSVECWSQDRLIGGLYGVYIQGVFSGESMFFKESNASKICLVALIEKLSSLGHTWFDIQMVTPILEEFGGNYVSRDRYLEQLRVQQKLNLKWK